MKYAFAVSLCLLLVLPLARADDGAPPAGRVRELAVKEVTVFKDGHAFVLESGTLPVNDGGDVVLDRLPTPVLGTFWPFADQEGATLESVRAGSETVAVARTALQLLDLLVANVGRHVVVTDVQNLTFHARIAAVPERTAEERRATEPPGDDALLPQRGALILLELHERGGGLKAMRLDQIREVVFEGDAKRRVTQIERRNRLTLDLRWKGEAASEAHVGMMYLQKGLRWIPSYKVDLRDGGKAHLKLQGTLVNDLRNLEDVSVNLVIGVPTFAFANQLDPISLQTAAAQAAGSVSRRSQMGQMFSNAIRSQVSSFESGGVAAPPGGPEVTGSDRREDLYVFRVEHVTLGKGQRLVIPVAEMEMTYEDLYTLEIPFSPPAEAWPQIAQRLANNPQEAALARLQAAPRVVHEVRLANAGPHPITTAPALVMRDGRVLAQGMLTYTSVGGKVDLPVTTAVDLHVAREDREIKRVPEDVKWRHDPYARIDMAGSITLTNYKKKTVHVEVTRFVLGTRPGADNGGKTLLMNTLEDASWTSWRPPVWWAWYSWPHWWYHFNGVARVSWDLELEPGQRLDLTYTWSYFWQ